MTDWKEQSAAHLGQMSSLLDAQDGSMNQDENAPCRIVVLASTCGVATAAGD